MSKHNKLKAWKELSGLEWSEIAKKLNLSESTLFKITSGETVNIQLVTIMAIKELTDLEVWDYIDEKKFNDFKNSLTK